LGTDQVFTKATILDAPDDFPSLPFRCMDTALS
jgi:hypothetical protein